LDGRVKPGRIHANQPPPATHRRHPAASTAANIHRRSASRFHQADSTSPLNSVQQHKFIASTLFIALLAEADSNRRFLPLPGRFFCAILI
jgi:hypothetical protein